MPADLHTAMRHIIDKSLAGEASSQEQQALREHLRTCAQCETYADEGRRAIAALHGFSFTADPALQAKVQAALALRAEQLQTVRPNRAHMVPPSRARIAQVSIAALLLTIVGSFGAWHIGDLLAAVLHLPVAPAHSAAVQTGLFTFWIAPSWCFVLLLPVLLLVSARSANRKGQVL